MLNNEFQVPMILDEHEYELAILFRHACYWLNLSGHPKYTDVFESCNFQNYYNL